MSPNATASRPADVPGAKRSDRISPRDLEVLGFIARLGVVPRGAVATWAATGRTATITRESRLRRAGLIRVARAYGLDEPLSLATRSGLRAAGWGELRPARLSAAAISHDTRVADLAAALERSGAALLSEREIAARERAAGERLHSARLSAKRFHRADLLLLDPDGEPAEAIEVELTNKAADRLDSLLRAWRRAVAERRLRGVLYLCPPRTLANVRGAIERTRTGAVIEARPLEGGGGTLAAARASSRR